MMGANFAAELAARFNWLVKDFVPLPVFSCAYDVANNILTISMTDARTTAVRALYPITMQIHTHAAPALAPKRNSTPNTINTIIRNTVQTTITETEPYRCYIDIFNTRNLYLTSSALASYDTVSNFGLDTIMKKIFCIVGFNTLLTQSSGSALDGLET
jgi:hypothetical protein